MTRGPLFGDRILDRLLPPDVAEEVVGDLREEWVTSAPGVRRSVRRAVAVLSILVHFVLRRRARADCASDFRLAARRLRQQPSFSVVAITGIALGVGVNLLLLAVAETVLFAPLPYPEGHRLAILTNDHSGSSTGGFGVSYDNATDALNRVQSLESVALYLDWQDVSSLAGDRAVRIPAAFVSDAYPRLLGLQVSLGRFILPEENQENAPAAVAVLGHGTWTSTFGSDPEVIGRTLTLNGLPYLVVGVAADDRGDLRYAWGQDPVGIYLPLFAAEPLVGFELDGDRGVRYLNALVRVQPGQSMAGAQSELGDLSADLGVEFPRSNEGWTYRLQVLDEALYESLRAPTGAILGISVLVLLLVSVNLVTLVLIRAVGRTTEVAVRRALGAGSFRIVRQLLAESTVVVVVGSALGLFVAERGLHVIATSQALRLPEFASLGIDRRVLVACSVSAMILILVLGLTPAVALLRADSAAHLGSGRRGSATRASARSQKVLVTSQVALAFVLLVGAGLLLESFRTLRATGYGFDTERLLLAQVDLRGEEYGPNEIRTFAGELSQRTAGLRGVQTSFIWSPNRLGHGNRVALLTELGRWETNPEERLEASAHTLHPGTLEGVGIRLLAGRDVAVRDDPESPRVALVSQALARAVWPGRDPIGQRLETREDGVPIDVAVIGVVSDARHRTRLIDPFGSQRDIYYAFAQRPWRFLTVGMRYSAEAQLEELTTGVREIVSALAPSVPVYGVTTMAQRESEEEGPARLSMILLIGYAALSVALATLGLYGVLAQGVRLQRREIGIRMALGADARVLMGRIVRRALGLTAIGILVGAAIAFPASTLLGSVLYGIEPHAPAAYALGLVALSAVALIASWLPVRRATAVAPSAVLRQD